jgi:hypothetical protein
MENASLHSRLRNCLLTILELEGSLTATCLGPALRDDFFLLKNILQRLENVHTDEGDVCRIEAATSRFLAELKETFASAGPFPLPPTRLLQ